MPEQPALTHRPLPLHRLLPESTLDQGEERRMRRWRHQKGTALTKTVTDKALG